MRLSLEISNTGDFFDVSWILERDRLPTFGETKADFFLRTLFFSEIEPGKSVGFRPGITHSHAYSVENRISVSPGTVIFVPPGG